MAYLHCCFSGVLGAVAEACVTVAAAVLVWSDRHHRRQQQETKQLQHLEQQQQQRQPQLQQILPVVHSNLATALLQVWSAIAATWPGKPSQLLVNGHLAPTLPDVIQLACAVFACAWPSDSTGSDPSSNNPSSSSSSRSRSRSANVVPASQQAAAKQALREAAAFAGYFGMQAVRGVSFANDAQQRQLLSGVASSDLLRVLLTDFALLCQQLHVGLKGRSPWAIDVSNISSSSSSSKASSSGSSSTADSRGSKQQMMPVPPYHTHLLAALNIGCAEELTRSTLTPMAIDLMVAPVLLQLLTYKGCARPSVEQQQQQQDVQQAGNSSTRQQQAPAAQAVQLQRLPVPDGLILPLLLCYIELPLLAPGPFSHPRFDDSDLARAALLTCLECVSTLVHQLITTRPLAFAERVLMHAVQPILWLLAPAVRQQLGLMAGKRKRQQQQQQRAREQQQQQGQRQQLRELGIVDKQEDERGLMMRWSHLMYSIADASGKLTFGVDSCVTKSHFVQGVCVAG
jgi:hypothetical protein